MKKALNLIEAQKIVYMRRCIVGVKDNLVARCGGNTRYLRGRPNSISWRSINNSISLMGVQ